MDDLESLVALAKEVGIRPVVTRRGLSLPGDIHLGTNCHRSEYGKTCEMSDMLPIG